MTNQTSARNALLRGIALETLIFTLAAFLPFVSIPAIVHAQETQFTPLAITDGLNVSRGRFTPESPDAFTLPPEQVCDLVINGWGWTDCAGIDAFVIGSTPETDSIILREPVSDGYVAFDDWTQDGADELSQQIEADLKASARGQSERTGQRIEFVGWRVDPTLDRDEQIMFYATDWSFDGDVTTNVNATFFDRRGYVVAEIIPYESTLDSARIAAIIRENRDAYHPAEGQDYASFVTGDKVAAVGALGLLGAFFGIKYGKAAAGGLAALLLFAKKFIVVIAVAALAAGGALFRAIGRMFGSRRDGGEV